jgi:tRNA G10  N-methylase Trm11
MSVTSYLYMFACHEDETDLCQLELRTLFGAEPSDGYILSSLLIDPSRSPFIKQRVSLLFTGQSPAEIALQVVELELNGAAFKVVFVALEPYAAEIDFEQKRAIEREIGWNIRGRAEMRKPERVFGIMRLGQRWLFGECTENQAVWLKHQKKPQNYSTALTTRIARAVANIAIPDPSGVKAVDPCCGIGTVLIEGLSMGVDMVGYDLNPLAVRGARTNLAFFGLDGTVSIGDMRTIQGSYDAAVLDLPYNLCSVISSGEQLEMLQSARSFARRVVVITTETIDSLIIAAGFEIVDRCLVKKGTTFVRQIIVCV